MIIEARNLNYNSILAANQSSAGQKTKELLRGFEERSYNINDIQAVQLPTLDELKANNDSYDSGGGYIDVNTIQRVEIKSIYESDYSAYDALSHCWLASSQDSSLSLYKSCSKVSDEAVKGMSKSDFLDYVRENGLDKEICWEGVEKYVSGTITYEDFTAFTDYAAAFFVGLEDRIKEDFSGDELQEQLEIINNLYEKAVQNFADQYTEKVSKSFKDSNVELSEEKLKASIKHVMDSKRADYAEFIKNNRDYAKIEGDEDSWLKRDAGFMTSALKNAFTPSTVESSDELWGENDIIAVGLLSAMYDYSFPAIDKAAAMLQNKDEESLGLAISMKWLSTQKVIVDLNVSDDIKGFANGLLDKYAKTLINNVNEALDKSRNNPMGASTLAFKPLDEKSIYNVLDVMKNAYNESGGNYEKAIYKTAKYAHDTVMSKLQSNEYSHLWRYNKPLLNAIDAKSFWSSFYDPDSKSKQGNGMGKLITKWNIFAGVVDSKDWKNFDSSANSFRNYTTSTFSGPIYGGYSNGKWWGTNLNDLV